MNNNSPLVRYRYPGPNAFKDNEVDESLLFGRNQETEELLQRILSSKLTLVYGRSGVGKTSLLRGKIFPRLRKSGYLPIRIRLNQRDESPIQAIDEAIQKYCLRRSIDYETEKGDTLWEVLGNASFSIKGKFYKPILIFDQFEEIFTLHDASFRKKLAEELGYIFSGYLPPSVHKKLLHSIESESAEEYEEPDPSSILGVFAIREAFVGSLNELAPEIPDILDNHFRLTKLDRGEARKSIENPAGFQESLLTVKAKFHVRPFKFKPESENNKGTVDEILDFMEGEDGKISPFQLQIICSFIEKIAESRQVQEDNVVIDVETDIGGKEGLERINKNFYLDAIAKLRSKRLRRKARDLCEYGLLSPEGYRDHLGERKIMEEYGLDVGDLDILVTAQLLRREPHRKTYDYELTHDTISYAVRALRPKASPFRRLPLKIKIAWLSILLFILLMPTIIFFKIHWQQQGQIEGRINGVYEGQLKERIHITNEFHNSLKKSYEHALKIEERATFVNEYRAQYVHFSTDPLRALMEYSNIHLKYLESLKSKKNKENSVIESHTIQKHMKEMFDGYMLLLQSETAQNRPKLLESAYNKLSKHYEEKLKDYPKQIRNDVELELLRAITYCASILQKKQNYWNSKVSSLGEKFDISNIEKGEDYRTKLSWIHIRGLILSLQKGDKNQATNYWNELFKHLGRTGPNRDFLVLKLSRHLKWAVSGSEESYSDESKSIICGHINNLLKISKGEVKPYNDQPRKLIKPPQECTS